MSAHQRVRAWIAQEYQKPAIDQEWLTDCSDWLMSELGLDPDRNFDQFIQHVEAQLLQSNLADSTVPGSGVEPLLFTPRPANVRRPIRQPKKTTGPTPLLVEIKSVTEIAHSAFNLLNIHQTRLDRADLGLAHDDNADQNRDEDEGPVPKFPRGMLRFELSDGLTTFRAIEFKSLPQLELGTTPLGYKIFLKSAPIRNGVAFLEPANVALKGYRTEDHDTNREQVFLSSLRRRLGRPDPPPEPSAVAQERIDLPVPPARQQAQAQAPPADIDELYVDDEVDPDVLREMTIQMDEAIEMQEKQRTGTRVPVARAPESKPKHPSSSDSKQGLRLDTTIASPSLNRICTASSIIKTSSYFNAHSPRSTPIPDIGLSPRPATSLSPDLDFTWGIDDRASSSLPAKKHGSVSANPPPSARTKKVALFEKRFSSPDPYDDVSFDMDVDDSFLEQVEIIEQGALGTVVDNKGKGRAEDTVTDSRVSAVGTKTRSNSTLGTKSSTTYPLSESSTRVQSGTKRGTCASSLSGSTDAPLPRSTQSSERRIPCDPSLILISSSEDEASKRGPSRARPHILVPKRPHKKRRMDQGDAADSDVIDISD